MTEEQIKVLCKLLVENSSRPLTAPEKEFLKLAIDKSQTLEQLFLVLMASRMR